MCRRARRSSRLPRRGDVERRVADSERRSCPETARRRAARRARATSCRSRDSPTSPIVSPRAIVKRDVVDGADPAGGCGPEAARCGSGSGPRGRATSRSGAVTRTTSPTAVDAGDAVAAGAVHRRQRRGAARQLGDRAARVEAAAGRRLEDRGHRRRRSAGCGGRARGRRAAARRRAARGYRDAPGARKMSRTAPVSTMRPAYMTRRGRPSARRCRGRG